MNGISWSLRAAVILSLGLYVSPAAAVDPALSGSVVVHFALSPDDPLTPQNESFWYFNGHSDNITLTLPSVLNISAVPGPGTLDWSTPANWTGFPLNTSGLSISQTGSGSFSYEINNGDANLDVLRGSGPTEYETLTNVAFTNITPSGEPTCPTCAFTVSSNTVDTRYNVTLPTGAHLNVSQFQVNVQNLTINSGASVAGAFNAIRQNLTNHGSGDFSVTVEGDFINDALSANGNVANATVLILQGQLQNSGELHVPQYFETQAATSNAGTMKLNGGQFIPQAAFSNNGTFQFSAGSVYGPGVVTNNGTFAWTGGQIVGSVVNATNSFTVSGVFQHLFGGNLSNDGTITQSSNSDLQIGGMGVLVNEAGALYDIVDDSTFSSGFQGGFINNAGTFRKSGGSGVSTIGPAFTNTGTISVTSGTLKFTGGGTFHSGTFSVATGKSAQLDVGTFFTQGRGAGLFLRIDL